MHRNQIGPYIAAFFDPHPTDDHQPCKDCRQCVEDGRIGVGYEEARDPEPYE